MDQDQTGLTHVYAALTPDCILQALQTAGFECDGGLHAMNSFENRVYAFRDHEKLRYVAKFYRPQRWNRAQIQEEQDFLFYLCEREIPVITPLRNDLGESVHEHAGFLFTVTPQRGGRALETGNEEQLEMLGRSVGRLHAASTHFPFQHRPKLDVANFARPALQATLASPCLPAQFARPYAELGEALLKVCEEKLQAYTDLEWISTHGDMHAGNVLWTGESVLMVDFDDARTAPAVQDLWMLAHNDFERNVVIAGYEEFHEFDWRQWQLAEVLRTMRLIQYTGWIAARWSDPTFPRHFGWFNTPAYFAEQIHLLQQQQDLLT